MFGDDLEVDKYQKLMFMARSLVISLTTNMLNFCLFGFLVTGKTIEKVITDSWQEKFPLNFYFIPLNRKIKI